MASETNRQAADPNAPHWMNISFLAVVHVLGICGAIYMTTHFLWATVIFAGVFYLARAISITAGYHRLWTHQTYDCPRGVQLFYLLFGAASFQNAVSAWASDHRHHHQYGDTDRDPYGINRGFWNAHMGWVLRRGRPDLRNVQDLLNDPLVAFQKRWYPVLGILMGVALPLLLGLLWGDPLGAFLVGSGLGLTIQYHSTFSVNSFAHWIGTKPYLKETSARNSLFVAIITFGEGGGHNRHHDRPSDYRTGVRWWSFDPPKWWIWGLSQFGLAWNLQTVP